MPPCKIARERQERRVARQGKRDKRERERDRSINIEIDEKR